jgi:hypothetical protein
VHLLVASIFIMVNASHTIATPTPSAELSRNTTSVVMCDTTRALELRTFDPPVPALGTVESAVVVSFAMTVGALPPLEPREESPASFAFDDDSLLAAASAADTTTRAQRPRAIEYSDAYHTRLKIHQIGAYAMLPLFITEYFVGQKLLTSTNRSHSLKSTHSLIAGAVGVVFASNTITGVWNAWDAREDPKGRTRREIHGVLMLASDAGVVWTAMSGGNAKRTVANARRHRTIAISSIALSAVGTGMMWLWRK